MKKRLLLSLLVLLTFFSITNVYAVPRPTNNFYINDYANLLSQETEDYILNTSVALEKETTAQVVVVTVPSLGGKSIEEYATDLFRKYGIGNKEKNNGLLLLLALDERKFRVEVGYGLEEVLPDGLTGTYQDRYIIPYLKEDKWDEGIKNGYNAFVRKLCDYYEVESLEVETVVDVSPEDNYEEATDDSVFIALVLGVIFGTIIGISINTKDKKDTKKSIIKLVTLIANISTFILLGLKYGSALGFIFLAAEAVMIIILIMSYNFSNSDYYGHGRGYRGSSSHHRSGGSGFGGFSGGGGRSGGGGSSRGF